MTAKGTFFPRRINSHVPNMQYAADVRYGGVGTVEIPSPLAGGAAVGTVTGDAEQILQVLVDTGAKFGRNVVLTASVAVGSATSVVVSIIGRDYLGQKMIENVTITHANGTTAQAGKKAFRYIETVISDGGGSASATIAVTTGNVLGLPYKSQKLNTELVNKEVPGNAGTFVDGAATGHTSSATSDDPRGTYAPHSSVLPDGSRTYELSIHHDTTNLHGDPQYWPTA